MLARERETNERLRQVDRLKDELVMVVAASCAPRSPRSRATSTWCSTTRSSTRAPAASCRRRSATRAACTASSRTCSRCRGSTAPSCRSTAPLDLAALTAGEIAASRAVAEDKGVGLDLVLPAGSSTIVQADEVRLAQVVDNLVTNAVKFTHEGGRVRVEVAPAGTSVCLVVSDTGIGIPVEEQDHLFERFFRASTATEQHIPGTGLGLAISKAIVDAHGGTIGVASAAGLGTTLRVTLPVSAAASAAA